MKTTQTLTLFLLLVFSAALFSCKKGAKTPPVKKDTTVIASDSTEISKLPPATQTGAHTFACLVNGKAFIAPGGRIANGSAIQCSYAYKTGIGHSFLVDGFDNAGDTSKSVIINADSLQVMQGQTYKFVLFGKGNVSGIYSTFLNLTPLTEYDTGGGARGELTITRLDTVGKIASGTFWFDAVRVPGDTVHVRNGRFDVDIILKK